MQNILSYLHTKKTEIFFWIAISILATLYFCGHRLDSDEGGTLNVAWQMWHHKTIYSSNFIEFISPGAGYLIFWDWKLFNSPSYLVANSLSTILWLISAVGVSLIVNRFTKGTHTRLIAVLAWLTAFYYYPIINHNTFSSMSAVFCLLFLLYSIKKTNKQTLWLILAGIFGAITFWLLQTKGLFVFAATVSAIIILKNVYKSRLKAIIIYISSYLAMLLLLFIDLNPKEVFYSLFILPQQNQYLLQNQNLFSPTTLFSEIIIMTVMAVVWYRQKHSPLGNLYLILTLFQGTLFLSFLNNTNIAHMTINIFPTIIFLAAVCTNKFKLKPLVLFQSLIFLPGIILGGIVGNLVSNNIFNDKTSEIFASNLIVKAKYIYAGPFLPGIYFETKKENPFAYPFTLNCPLNCQEKMLETFQKYQPEVAILNYGMVRKFDYNIDNPLDNYILNNYKKCQRIIGTDIYSKTTCE